MDDQIYATASEEHAAARRRSGIDGPGVDPSERLTLTDAWEITTDSVTALSPAALSISEWLDSVMARLPIRYESDYDSVALVALWTQQYDRLHALATGRRDREF